MSIESPASSRRWVPISRLPTLPGRPALRQRPPDSITNGAWWRIIRRPLKRRNIEAAAAAATDADRSAAAAPDAGRPAVRGWRQQWAFLSFCSSTWWRALSCSWCWATKRPSRPNDRRPTTTKRTDVCWRKPWRRWTGCGPSRRTSTSFTGTIGPIWPVWKCATTRTRSSALCATLCWKSATRSGRRGLSPCRCSTLWRSSQLSVRLTLSLSLWSSSSICRLVAFQSLDAPAPDGGHWKLLRLEAMWAPAKVSAGLAAAAALRQNLYI